MDWPQHFWSDYSCVFQETQVSEPIKHERRRLLSAAALTIAAAELGMIGFAEAQPGKINPIKPGTNTSFGALKQIDAGVLNIGYAEAGHAHALNLRDSDGWPYDIHSYGS